MNYVGRILSDISLSCLGIIVWLFAPLLSWLVCPSNQNAMLSNRLSSSKIKALFYQSLAVICVITGAILFLITAYHWYQPTRFLDGLTMDIHRTLLLRPHLYATNNSQYPVMTLPLDGQTLLFSSDQTFIGILQRSGHTIASLAILLLSYILLKKARKHNTLAIEEEQLNSGNIDHESSDHLRYNHG